MVSNDSFPGFPGRKKVMETSRTRPCAKNQNSAFNPFQSKNKRYRHFLQRFSRLSILLHRIIDNCVQILIKQFIITDKTMPFHLFLLLNYLFIFLHDLPPASYCLPISVSAGMYLYAQHFPNLHLL